MNKGILVKNLIISLVVFVLAAILFSGCPSSATNSPVVENKNTSTNQQGSEKKTEPVSVESAAKQKEVLMDSRKSDYGKPQQFSKAETDTVLKYVLGEDKWDSELGITNRVSGAFTKPNAKETLYFVTGCKDESGKFVSNSTCGHVGWNSAGWIAVYDGTTPILKIEQSLGSGIEKITDVNGDQINEILSSGGYTGMGIVNQSLSLGQISGGKYQEIKSFRGWADNCADSLSKDKKAIASLVTFIPSTGGKIPEFAEEYFQTKCEGDEVGKNPQWNKMTKKEFDEFFDSIS